jgi:hypothetical protein
LSKSIVEKKLLKGVKMTTAKWTSNNTGAQQDLRYSAARFHEKGCLHVCGGGDALISSIVILVMKT